MLTIHVEFPVVSGVDSLLPHFEDMVRLAKHLNVHVQAEWRDFEVHAWPDSVAEFMLNSLKEDAKLDEAMYGANALLIVENEKEARLALVADLNSRGYRVIKIEPGICSTTEDIPF